MNVIIMQGVPGSGKSTWVAQHKTDAWAVVSSDDFHVREDGVYEFKEENLARSHDECLRIFLEHVRNQRWDTVVVDNTNLTAAELSPYYRLAEIHGCDVKVVRVHAEFEACVARQTHGVPLAKLWSMYQLFLSERMPARYKVELECNSTYRSNRMGAF